MIEFTRQQAVGQVPQEILPHTHVTFAISRGISITTSNRYAPAVGKGTISVAFVCPSVRRTHSEQAVRLGGRHNMPLPRDLDF